MTRVFITLATALAIAAGGPAWSHPHEKLAVKINPDDRTELLRLDLESGQPKTLYRATRGRITEARVSPYYSRVALIETTAPTSSRGAAPVNRLVVITAKGAILRTVDADVRRFVFSPDGRRIAYIVGPFYPGGIGFLPQRAFILDIDSRVDPLELAGLDKPHDLHWVKTPRENSIYVKVLRDGEDRVLRWDVATRQAEETPLKGIRFSPDGEFLLAHPYETIEIGDCEPGNEGDSCLRIIERTSGQELRSLAEQKGAAQGWIYDRGHHLLFVQRDPRTETISERRAGRELQADLITGYSAAGGLVFEVGSDKPPVRVDGIIGGEASAGDWVTGSRGIVVASSDPAAPLAVCEQLPCEKRDDRKPGPEPSRLPAPAADRLEPEADEEFEYANPRFRWASIEGAGGYQLDVCSDRECGVRVAGSSQIIDTEWRSSALPLGELYWRVAAVEDLPSGTARVGAFTSPTRFFVRSERIDRDPPVATIKTTFRPGERVAKGNVALNAPTVRIVPRVDDAVSGVDWWRADIDGRTIADSRDAEISVLEGPWPDGTHRVDIAAEDRAGNSSTVASGQFVVDAQAPRIVLQFVEPEIVVDKRGAASRLSARDFQWFKLTEDSELGITSVFFDRPGEPHARRRREPAAAQTPLAYTSAWPELLLFVRGEWPFGASLEADASGRRLLWLAATDDGSGAASLQLRIRTPTAPSGAAQVLEVIATDMVGNASQPLTLELIH
ncbi:MAG: hypothetical protein OEM62_08895 [Acidobacteriota bacterium]|nr:hypothetical protein [Acidobacteriota bacterium]